MKRLVNWGFAWLYLPFLRLTTLLGGETAWRFWERLIRWLGFIVGWMMRPRGTNAEPVIEGMARMTDWADGLIDAQGEWVQMSTTHAVKQISACPYAERLGTIPAFCTRLGVMLGIGAFRVYAPRVQLTYDIPATLSGGASHCRYVLNLEYDLNPEV